jgi:hypothetical protein
MSDLFANTPLPSRFDKVEKTDLTGVEQVALRADSRDVELTRRFERAENLKRQDLNAASAFDVAAIGQFGQEIFQQEVNDVRQMIVSGELDPVEARAKIGELTSLYGQFSAHADAMKDKDAEALGLIEDPAKREAYQKRMGIGEELSYGADDYAVQHNLAMNGVFERGSAQKVNGQWTVIDPNTGQRVPFSQVTGFADPNHFYRYGTKAVDVGTLDDWAKSKATVSAIGFRDGKWDEGRARSTYRDNILTVDDIGRTHRLQLLGTLEDRGLVDHLTDEQKRAFRNGDYTVQTTGDGQQIIVDANGQRLTAFEEIIAKGEDEFVERSRFDMTIGDGKKKGSGSGSGSGNNQKSNIVAGGMSIPQSAAAGFADLSDPEMEKHLAAGGAMGHTLNRFSKPPTIVGTYRFPDHPNTQKVHIHAVGVNEVGQRVAYILGEEVVETPNPLGPDFPSSTDTKEFWQEVKIGPDEEGVGADIYQEIYQNQPDMADLVDSDRSSVLDARVRAVQEKKPEPKEDASKARRERGESALEKYRNLERQYNQLAMVPGSTKSREEVKSDMDSLLQDETVGPYIKERIKGSSPEEIIPSEPEKIGSDLAKESSSVIAGISDEMKDRVTAKINEALPQKIYAFETENSVGEKAIGFKNEAGEDTGEMIFFS